MLRACVLEHQGS
jgi:hypothetical protein